MTLRNFDPRNLGQYSADKPPQMLHFQYKGSEDVFRYVLVERIKKIDHATRRKPGEGMAEDVIREKYKGDVSWD